MKATLASQSPTDTIQQSIRDIRRVSLEDRIAEFEKTELGGEFSPGSFEINDAADGFTGFVSNGFSSLYRSYRRGETISFDEHAEIII